MREFVYLAAVAVYLTTMVSVAHSENCPESGRKNITHETDCKYFYTCHMGKKFSSTCGEDDMHRQLCFVEGHKTCGLYNNCYCLYCPSLADDHKWPDPSNENAYYQCNEGMVEHKKCLDDQKFDEKTLDCIIKNNDRCPSSGSGQGKRYPHDCFCNMYSECQDGKEVGQECSEGLLFDVDVLTCRAGQDARCHNEPSKCPQDGIFPNSTSCYYYYKCEKGVKTSYKCNYGMVFDKKKRVCVNWDQGDCTTPNPNGCNWEKPRKPNPKDCNRYYECVNGYVEDRKCYENHYFNDKTLLCDLWKNVDCSNRGNGGNTPVNNPSGDCPSVDCGKLRFPHKICEWYYECWNGIKIAVQCPSGLAYNENSEMCDLPKNVKCPKPPPLVCVPGSLHPHECQCHKYYTCGKNQEKIVSRCPDEKNFDKVTRKCVPAAEANCHKEHKNVSFNQNMSHWFH